MGCAVAAAARGASRFTRSRFATLGLVREPTPPYGSGACDIDAVEDLAEEIAILAADLHSAKERFLSLVARFDALKGWKLLGHRTCAHWLSARTGLDLGTAREHVRVARAMSALPETRAAMSRGELSFSQVRALTRVAQPETESDLVGLARDCTTSVLERMVRAWKKGSRQEEASRERLLHESRRLSVFPNEDGMYVVLGLLEPEVAVLLLRALEAAGDALYRARGPLPVGPARPGRVTAAERAAAQHRADSLGLLTERALAAGFGATGGESQAGACCGTSDHDDAPAESKESAVQDEEPVGHGEEGGTTEDRGAPISGTRAERYQVVLHVEAETLAAEGEPGLSELEDGTRVSAETSRRLSCDSGLIRMTRSPEGEVLDVGRKTRTIPPALRRALEVRDRGCRFPGCGLRFTEAHHVVHWADGGETSLENTLLLCRYHHRLVHEDGWTVEWWGTGRPAFRDPRGSAHFAPRRRDLWERRRAPHDGGDGDGGDVVDGHGGGAADGEGGDGGRARADRLVANNRARGVGPDGWTAGARWEREADIPDEVLFRATEAAL